MTWLCLWEHVFGGILFTGLWEQVWIPLGFGGKLVYVRVMALSRNIPFLLHNHVVKKLEGDILNSQGTFTWHCINVSQPSVHTEGGHTLVQCDDYSDALKQKRTCMMT